MKQRKKCDTCGQYLESFQGQYLHPDTVCNGVKDYIFIEATVQDTFMHDKFIEMYGVPDISDYTLLEQYELILNKPLIKLILWVSSLFKKK